MKHLAFFLVLVHCFGCRAEALENKNNNGNAVGGPAESRDDGHQEPNPRTDAEEVDQELVLQRDIWTELSLLIHRVTVAENLVRSLQEENSAQAVELAVAHEKLRALQEGLAANEDRVEELKVEQEAQAVELVVTHEKLRALQEGLAVNEGRVEGLQVEQEGQKAAVEELQTSDRARKVAFSASLLSHGEGNCDPGQLVYRHVITNVGTHYSPTTGAFTAPVRGVYYFRITAHVVHSDFFTRLGIFKNGQLIVTSGDRHGSADPEDSASNAVAMQLEVGDVVSVQLGGVVWDDQYHRTTFTGFLLFSL